MNDNPFLQKTPHCLLTATLKGSEQLLCLTLQRGWPESLPSCTRAPWRKVVSWGCPGQRPSFAMNFTAKARANKYRLHCGIQTTGCLEEEEVCISRSPQRRPVWLILNSSEGAGQVCDESWALGEGRGYKASYCGVVEKWDRLEGI